MERIRGIAFSTKNIPVLQTMLVFILFPRVLPWFFIFLLRKQYFELIQIKSGTCKLRVPQCVHQP